MINIDQHIITNSLNQALSTDRNLIDGRTEQDYLFFLSNFASVINFYDHNNKINGNWSPFLLKDPVFLLALISKTDFNKQYSLYLQTCTQLERVLTGQQAISIPSLDSFIANSFNQLFTQLIGIYTQIEKWTSYMFNSVVEYDLKTYIIKEVKTKISTHFWAIIELQNALFKSSVITIVLNEKFEQFETNINGIWPVEDFNFDKENDIWTLNKDRKPFWEVLQFELYSALSTKPQLVILEIIRGVGNQLFQFFNNIIHHADKAYYVMDDKPSPYPDTLLLRIFLKLLKNQKDQLNGLSQKHLDFYYQDILKQTLQTAKPDKVFINIELAKKELYSLPKGSVFNAGFDNRKAPILFESISEVQLNPATIPSVFTLCSKELNTPVLNVINKRSSLYLNSIITPNKLIKNEAGEVQSWSTFGNKEEKVPLIKIGFSVASPMFFLREGDRILTMELTFVEDVPNDVFQNAIFSLSTANSWLNIPFNNNVISQFDDDCSIVSKTGYLIQAEPTNAKVLTILINLDKSQPSIAPLLLNDMGIESDWPMFKIVFSEFENIQSPPALLSLAVKVEVNGIETLQLSNQNGALSSLTPFQPFGPIASLGSSFVIGSDEVYSKPIESFELKLVWNNLPKKFQDYYQIYNDYLASIKPAAKANPASASDDLKAKVKTFGRTEVNTLKPKITSVIGNVTSVAVKKSIVGPFSWLITAPISKYIVNPILNIFKGKKDETTTAKDRNTQPFNDLSFKVNFDFLENGIWTNELILDDENKTALPFCSLFDVGTPKDTTSPMDFATVKDPIDSKDIEIEKNSVSNITSESENDSIFEKEKVLLSNSIFNYKHTGTTKLIPNPDLQLSSVKFSEKSISGFMRMNFVPEVPDKNDPIKIPNVYGFGNDLYPQIVSYIASLNSLIVSDSWGASDITKVKPVANPPFSPKASKVVIDKYKANIKYDFSTRNSPSGDVYPVQCFYYTPLGNYKVFDNKGMDNDVVKTLSISEKSTFDIYDKPIAKFTDRIVPVLLDSDLKSFNNVNVQLSIPLYPAFTHVGALYINLQNIVTSAELNLYFELSPCIHDFNDSYDEAVDYLYLGPSGWESLDVLADRTNKFSCSGIITFNIPEIKDNPLAILPDNAYWICISTNKKVNAKTIYLSTNGVELQRSGTNYLTDTSRPLIVSEQIKSTLNKIPSISAINQMFPSFDGKGAEDNIEMNKRVSLRLKTKDRASSAGDYFDLIKQEFPEVYFSKTVFNKKKNITNVYIANFYSNDSSAGAYYPLITSCLQSKIQNFLTERASALANVNVSNFEFAYLTVKATIYIKQGFEIDGMKQSINHGLNVYLSPWINSTQQQVIIGQEISAEQVSAFITGLKGVDYVQDIDLVISDTSGKSKAYTLNESDLIVSASNHQLVINPVL